MIKNMTDLVRTGVLLAGCSALALAAQAGSTNVVTTATDAALRSAIAAGGWVSFTCTGTIGLTNSISITNNVILDGTGVNLVISGGGSNRIFIVSSGASLAVTNLVLANGVINSSSYAIPAEGGAIENNGGTVSLTDCLLTNNAAINNNLLANTSATNISEALGGAIYNNGGSLSLVSSSLSNNATSGAFSYGGAICSTGGITTIVSSQISSNLCYYNENFPAGSYGGFYGKQSWADGGAVCLIAGTLNLTNSLLSANLALGTQGGGGDYFADGPYWADGGAVANLAGTVNLDGCQISGNNAHGNIGGVYFDGFGAGTGAGGAIWSAGTLNVIRTAITGNEAVTGSGAGELGSNADGPQPACGGAVYNAGNAVFNDCQITSNTATADQSSDVLDNYNESEDSNSGTPGYGAGIFNGGHCAMTNCTVALNTALGGQGINTGFGGYPSQGSALGGGIFNTNLFTAMNVTIASNSCVSPGNGGESAGLATGTQIINTNGGSVQLHNTLLAYGNTNGNYYGPLTDQGHNLNSDASAPFTSGTSTNSVNPQLAPLANYGGPTLSMDLLGSSPAIGSGDTSGAPAVDQRGYYRIFAEGVDIGAIQYAGTINAPAAIVTQPASTTTPAGGNASFSVGATGATPITYQWQQNGTNLPGATAATLTLTNLSLSQSGYYYSVTVSNAVNAVQSGTAWLTVTGPALAINVTGTNSLLGFTALSSKTYDLLVSSNLTTWTTQQVIGPFGTSSNFSLPLGSLTNGSRFYRVWQP